MTPHLRLAGAALVALLSLASPALAQDAPWRHATSLIAVPKYPAGFTHFDYANPDAPKGGTVRLSEIGSFDTFNPILPQGEVATGLGLVYEPLMTRSLEEDSTEYGLLAEAISFPADYASVSFRMNPRARWHDGKPVTAEDVVWSFEKSVELNPSLANYYHNVTKAEVTGEGIVTFTFDQAGNRELPTIMAQLTVLPKHWWEGTDANGKQRNIAGSTLELPMGSGPYRIATFAAGRSATFERVKDYWGAAEPVNVGHNNFDQIRYEYFSDTDVEFEAFKADQYDWRVENRAKRWAISYDFPAVKEGRVVQELFENPYRSSGVMVGFVPNVRLAKFQDPRVRKALNYAFDFEELNRTVFYGQYERVNSFFYGLPIAASGLPEGKELEILQSVKDQVPASVFTEPYANPVGGDPTKLRANLRQALQLLTEAGYTLDGTRLVNAAGEQLGFEILLNGPTIEPVATAFANNLRTIGIAATIRSVDSAQYVNRLRTRDFEVTYTGWGQSLSPGNEQRDFWGSAAADQQDSRNYAGIKDPAIDALIDQVIFAKDRETLEAATKALDRVLLANAYVVPSYALRKERVARWDRFSRPETLPALSIGFPDVWWWDEAKAAKTGSPG